MSLSGNILGAAMGGSTGNNSDNSLLQSAVSLINRHGGIEGLQRKFHSNNLDHIF